MPPRSSTDDDLEDAGDDPGRADDEPSDDAGWDDDPRRARHPEGPDEEELAGQDDDELADPCPHCGRPMHEHAEICPHCGKYASDAGGLGRGRAAVWIVIAAVLALLAMLPLLC